MRCSTCIFITKETEEFGSNFLSLKIMSMICKMKKGLLELQVMVSIKSFAGYN